METVLGNPRMVVSSRSSPAQAWKDQIWNTSQHLRNISFRSIQSFSLFPLPPPCLPSPFAVFEFVSTPRRLEGTPVRLPINFDIIAQSSTLTLHLHLGGLSFKSRFQKPIKTSTSFRFKRTCDSAVLLKQGSKAWG